MPLFRKSSARVLSEASEWAYRLERDRSQDTLAQFERWRSKDPRHAEAFASMSEILDVAGQVSPASEAARPISPRPPAAPQGARLAFAVSFGVVAVALVLLLLVLPRFRAQDGPADRLALATDVGEIREVELADGSHVVLDSMSGVEGRFDTSERRLTLRQGRARFRVAPERRPFLVTAGNSEMAAAESLFDVSLIDGRTEVAVLAGSVEVRRARPASGSTRTELSAGEKLTIVSGAEPLRQRVPRGETLWPRRMLEFEGTPLEQAVSLANRYSRERIVVEDPAVAALRVSGAFRAGDTAGLARSLAAAFDLRLERRPDGTLLLTR